MISDAVGERGRVFATLGDGLSGVVADEATARAAVGAANRRTVGRMASGAGLTLLTGQDPDAAARQAQFALHVTKTLKGTAYSGAATRLFGHRLTPPEADAALAFLTALHTTGPTAPGFHHLAHAYRWRSWWRSHLPVVAWPRLGVLLSGVR
ncbi:hypothetical protein SSCG_04240 [Streptomyces clavuligerus]|nr:hypothetical protein [Streptomyces clavuligerus]EDY51260.1 hypothetical protein SSCG_04240 [Streptomyces clavuligerus]